MIELISKYLRSSGRPSPVRTSRNLMDEQIGIGWKLSSIEYFALTVFD